MLALIIIVTERLRQSRSESGEEGSGVSLASVWCCPLWTSLYHLIIGCSHRTFSSKIINQYFYFLCCFSPDGPSLLTFPSFRSQMVCILKVLKTSLSTVAFGKPSLISYRRPGHYFIYTPTLGRKIFGQDAFRLLVGEVPFPLEMSPPPPPSLYSLGRAGPLFSSIHLALEMGTLSQ